RTTTRALPGQATREDLLAESMAVDRTLSVTRGTCGIVAGSQPAYRMWLADSYFFGRVSPGRGRATSRSGLAPRPAPGRAGTIMQVPFCPGQGSQGSRFGSGAENPRRTMQGRQSTA